MMAKGTFAILVLSTTDLDGIFERLQAGDAEVVQEPRTSRTASATARSAIPRGT